MLPEPHRSCSQGQEGGARRQEGQSCGAQKAAEEAAEGRRAHLPRLERRTVAFAMLLELFLISYKKESLRS